MTQADKQQVVLLANSIIQNVNTLKLVFQDEKASDAECKATLMAFASLIEADLKVLKTIYKTIE